MCKLNGLNRNEYITLKWNWNWDSVYNYFIIGIMGTTNTQNHMAPGKERKKRERKSEKQINLFRFNIHSCIHSFERLTV